jgi:glycopeptide antibiotics resistance protein
LFSSQKGVKLAFRNCFAGCAAVLKQAPFQSQANRVLRDKKALHAPLNAAKKPAPQSHSGCPLGCAQELLRLVLVFASLRFALHNRHMPQTSTQRPHLQRPYKPSNTAFWLGVAYAGLIVYITLHPLSAIRWTEATPWGFAFKPWTMQGVTAFDTAVNVLAYLPLGWLWARQLQALGLRLASLGATGAPRWLQGLSHGAPGVLLISSVGLGLSFVLESIQSYSPARVASLLDVLCNTLGTCTGALLAQWFRLGRGATNAWLHRTIAPHGGAFWAVVGLWAIAQLHPQGWTFMTAPLATLTDTWLPSQGSQSLGFPLNSTQLRNLETVSTVVALTGVLALLRLGLNHQLQLLSRAGLLLLGFVGVLVWQILSHGVQYGWGEWRFLVSEGVLNAAWVMVGVCAAWMLLPAHWVTVGAVMALALHTALAQMLPPHPYSTSAALWQQGRWVHVYGLTGVISALWPILALAALVLQSRHKTNR